MDDNDSLRFLFYTYVCFVSFRFVLLLLLLLV